MILQLDIGNSRVKWRVCAATQVIERGVVSRVELRQLALPDGLRPDQIWVSSVAGPALEQELVEQLQQRFDLAPWFARSSAQACGLRNSYADPARMGVDRWLAMLAAWKQAYDMGLEIPASDVGNMLGVRAPDKGEKILSLAAEQQQQEQMMQLGRGGGVGMPPRPGPQIGPATPGPNESAVGMGDSERRRRAKKNGNGVATPDEQGEDYDASAEIDDHRLSGQAARRQLLSTLDKRGAVLAQGQAPGERTRVLDYEGE